MGNKIGIKVCVFVEDNNKLLLLKEWSKKRNGYFWNVIKGTYDQSEESLFECAKREAQEEAGIEIELTGLINCKFRYGNRTVLYFSFIAKSVKGIPVLPNRDEQEKRAEDIQEVAFFTKDEIKKIQKEEFISDGIYETIQEWLQNKPFPLEVVKQSNFK